MANKREMEDGYQPSLALMCSILPVQKVLLPESWLLPRDQDWPLGKRSAFGQVPSAPFRKRIPSAPQKGKT